MAAGRRMRYQRITRQADEVTCLAEEYYDGCMLKRNREMINTAPTVWSIAPSPKEAQCIPPTERNRRAYI